MNARYLIPLAVLSLLTTLGCDPGHGKGGVWWNGEYQDIMQKYPFIRANSEGQRLTYKCDGTDSLPAPTYFNANFSDKIKTFGSKLLQIHGPDRSCEAFAVGETRSVETLGYDLDHETPVQAAYRVDRMDAQNYRITIPILFAATCASAEFKSKDIVNAWAKRIQSCFDQADPYMHGPDGSNLHLQIEVVSDAASKQAFHSVQIYPIEREFRENSGMVSPSSSCSTLLHESFHWLGMVDEYHIPNGVDHVTDLITGRASTFECGCRSIGPDDSVMNSPFMAWINAVEGKNHSLLYPAEAKGLLNPGCADKNSTYYQCAKLAYTSSCDAGKVPATCRDASWVK